MPAGSGLTPEGLAQGPGGGNPPPRQLLVSHADARRVAAHPGGHALVERRVRRPALGGVRVRAVIIGTAATRETAERPVATPTGAGPPTRWGNGSGGNGSCRRWPGFLGLGLETARQDGQEARQDRGSSFHGILSLLPSGVV